MSSLELSMSRKQYGTPHAEDLRKGDEVLHETLSKAITPQSLSRVVSFEMSLRSFGNDGSPRLSCTSLDDLGPFAGPLPKNVIPRRNLNRSTCSCIVVSSGTVPTSEVDGELKRASSCSVVPKLVDSAADEDDFTSPPGGAGDDARAVSTVVRVPIDELPLGKSTPSYHACGDDEEGTDDSGAPTADVLEYNSFAGRLDPSFSLRASSSAVDGHDDEQAGQQQQGYTTLARAAFHIFKGNVGAGVFLLPTFYQDAGYALGAVCVVVLGLIMIDCCESLLRVKQAIHRSSVKTYPAVVDFVLGPWFKYFTQFALIFTQFGFCIMFVQYASSMFAALFNAAHMYEFFVVLSVILVTPMTFLSDRMALLAYVSVVAGAFVVIVLTGTAAVDIKGLSTHGIAPGVVAAIPTTRLLVFLSGHMFSLEGIGVVLPVENSVAPSKQREFRSVVKYTLLSVVVLYVVFGVLGYLAYGESLHTSVVLALPSGYYKQSLQLLLGLSLLLGYPIQYVPAIQLVDKALGVSVSVDRKKAYMVRIALNGFFGLTALFIGGDTLNIFASFLGAFVGVHLMITIPTLLNLQLDYALSAERASKGTFLYLMQMFKGPYTAREVRLFSYLLLAAIVWVGGVYYTFVAVFQDRVSGTSSLPTNSTEFSLD